MKEKDMPQYSIYIATTKEFNPPIDDAYKPIVVGYALNQKHPSDEYINDASGINISDKNPYYCELTALYWMWKNSNADVIGLCHYRRYLSKRKHAKTTDDVISTDEIKELLMKNDVILPRKSCLYGSVREQYKTGQNVKDYDLSGEIIKELYPEYYDSFLKVSKQDSIYLCNIFIGKKELINSYCQWIFDILFELEKRIDITGYSKQQKRVYGFLGERLFNVWLDKNKPQICEVKMYNTEQRSLDSLRRYVHLFEYKWLKIDYLKFSYKRRLKRERNAAKIH